MSTSVAAPPEKKRALKRATIGVAVLLLLCAGAMVWFVNSDLFRQTVRNKVIAELERATGGKVEIQSLTWTLSTLHFEARGFTIHGREGAGEAPYAHAGLVSVHAGIASLFSRKVVLRNVLIDDLTLHLIQYPDGTTNQPAPQAGKVNGDGKAEAERLYDLAVNHVEVKNGTLLLNEERLPFEVSAERLSAALAYSQKERGYDGNFSFSLLSGRWRDFPPQQADVELQVLLRESEAEIRHLKVSNQHSTVEAWGAIHSFTDPRVTLQYQASLDLPELAKLANVPELRAGHADVKGGLTSGAGKYVSQGSLTVQKMEWKDERIHSTGIDVASPFSIDPGKLSFPRLAGRFLGGTGRGTVEITNWNASTKIPSQKGQMTLQLSGVQLKGIADAVATPALPLNRIPADGIVSGDIKSDWSGSMRNARTELKLDVDPPANASPEQIPVTAQLRATYHGDTKLLDVGTLNAATRTTRLSATGELGSDRAQAKVSLNSTDLRELRPAIAVLSPGTKIPILLQGRASYNGSVSGKLNALATHGKLEMEGFESNMPAPPVSPATSAGHASPRRIQWDSLVTDLSYSPSSVSFKQGTLKRGKASFGFSGTAALHNGMLEKSSQLNLMLHVQDADVGDVQSLLGTNYPLAGTLNADIKASGIAENLHGTGNLQISKLTAYGEPFRLFRSDVQFAGTQIDLSNILLAHNGAQLSGSFGYNVDDRRFRFDLKGENVELASLRRFEFRRLSMAGQASFHVTGSGTQDAPQLSGQLDVRNLVLNKETVGSISVAAETRGADLVLRGSSNLENASLTMDGTVQMRGDYPGQMKIYFSHLDFDPLIRAYFQGQITGHSSIAGTVEIRGPFKRPRDLMITGNATQLSAEVENIKLQNDGPVRFAMDGEVARLQQFHLVGDNNDAFVQGSIKIVGDHALDLHARGRLDLKLLQGYNPDVIAYGPATFSVDVAGTPEHPQMSGRFDLANAAISLADLPNGLSQINGTLIFAQDRIQIEKLTAHTGGGELNLGGFLAYRNGLYFDLTATGKDVRLRYPPGVSSSADASLRYTGSARSSQLSGDILVTRLGMNPRFDLANYLTQSRKSPALSTLNPFLDNLRLDVHITSTPELQVETSLARVSGNVDLRLRGTAARPALLGRVTIAEGDVFFNGTKYRLERGDISFSNPLTIEPVVNLDMSARVQDYDITIGLHGAVTGGKNLSMTYRSDPPLANADIIALLAFGRTRGQDLYSAGQPGQAGSDTTNASNAILSQALNATFSDRVQRLFGASRVKIDPLYVGPTSASNNPTPRVTIEQQINRNVTVTYITSVTQQSQTVVQLEYNIDKNVSIVAVRDENGVLGFDVHIRRRKK